MQKLPRRFYARPTLRVARDLLGKYFVRRTGNHVLVGKIVEVEAYLGSEDAASHAFRGKTRRNEVMFGKAGHLYVYFTYGMHFCANIVTGAEGTAGAVLIRGIEPLKGRGVMERNRSRGGRVPTNLTNGPARFCEAFGIGRNENGADLLGPVIYLTHGEDLPASKSRASTRVGIRAAREKKWRYFLPGNACVSR